jgi:hypothetical protein
MPWDWIALVVTVVMLGARVVANLADRPSEPTNGG